ncbi:MAG: head-tail connector protein [Qipengyuania sp.]
MRAITGYPDLSGEPLTELKQYLSISGTRDDALLVQMLRAAHAMCERFTGLAAQPTQFDVVLPELAGWQAVEPRPVIAIGEARLESSGGALRVLTAAEYETRIDHEGVAHVRLQKAEPDGRLVLAVTAAVSPSWDMLEPDLRQGIVRLAAHAYRERDAGPQANPPAAVAALWRPYRRLRL